MQKAQQKVSVVIKVLLIALLVLSMSSVSGFAIANRNPSKAYAYNTAKAHVWYNSILAQITTSGSIQVTDDKIIDITAFVEKAKKGIQNPGKEAETNINNNINGEYLDPLIWDFRAFPEEKTDINVEDIRMALIDNNDAVKGSWQTVSNVPYDEKWHGNAGPIKQCYSYDSKLRQICLYTNLVNADKVTEKSAAEIMTAMSGSTDPKVWSNITKCEIASNYTIERAGIIYKDVADFQWRYVSDSWMADTYNVNLTLTVPIGSATIASPLGKVTQLDTDKNNLGSVSMERNIYAWGHGSSSGVVTLSDNGTITLKNDIVPAGTNAEVRVVFPSAWLTNLDKNSDISHQDQTKLASILREEFVWRDERTNSVNALILPLIFVPICILLLVLVLIVAMIYKKKFYLTEVPIDRLAELHPSILTRLKNWNREFPHDLAASILFLKDCNLINLEKMHSGDFKMSAIDKKLLITSKIDNKIDKIDTNTVNLIFNTCATETTQITLQDLENFTKARSKEFLVSYLTWHSYLTDRVNKLTNFTSKHDNIREGIFFLAGAIVVIGAFLAFFFSNWIVLVCGLFTGLIMCFVANSMRNHLTFKDKKGNVIRSEQIAISFAQNNPLFNEFADRFTETIDRIVKEAQDRLNN